MTILAIVIGAVWLFAIVPDLRGTRLQRPYPSLEQCERARAALLERFPHAFAVCDSGLKF